MAQRDIVFGEGFYELMNALLRVICMARALAEVFLGFEVWPCIVERLGNLLEFRFEPTEIRDRCEIRRRLSAALTDCLDLLVAG
jgi:hypothetical protein